MDWNGFVPDQYQAPPTLSRREARLEITPVVEARFFVQSEFDDGNGMWLITGVSLPS